MPPKGIVGWTIFALGLFAGGALWFIPIGQLRSGLAGVLLLILAVFFAYFEIDTWYTVGLAIAGVVCLVVFWVSDPPGRKKGGI